MGNERIPILLDTDIGSDIDDAVTLAYLLKQPRCELLGITTVTGDTQVRAGVADILCRIAGRPDMPIYAGRGGVLLEGLGQPGIDHGWALDHYPHRPRFPENALEFLRESIRKRPGEITLLCIGPLTNIGALFAYDPEIPRLLKRLVLMAGRFREAGAEWNIRVDPLAGGLTFKAPVPDLLSVGLDVTFQCIMKRDEILRKFKGPLLSAIAHMMGKWRKQIVFHDPLTAACIFEPKICGYSRGWVKVDIHDSQDRGATTFVDDPKGPHLIADRVNSKTFFKEYFRVTTRK